MKKMKPIQMKINKSKKLENFKLEYLMDSLMKHKMNILIDL